MDSITTIPKSREISIRLKDLSCGLGLNDQEVLSLLSQLSSLGVNYEREEKEEEAWIKIKVDEKAPIKAVMELMGQFFPVKKVGLTKDFIQLLDAAIMMQKPLKVFTDQDKVSDVHPLKLVHLEGDLSLIAEDCHDHCMRVFKVCDLLEVQDLSLTTMSRVYVFEIEEFIEAIRSMNEKETRLILKIHNPQLVNLFPEYHFLGKPCMITNPNGDIIWAAYVEACGPLFDWVLSLEGHAEILDPSSFKDEYLSYCEAKVKKMA
jgi:hypothetical protein